MPEVTTEPATRAFVVLNPTSGSCTAADVRAALGRHFGADDAGPEIHEIGQGDDLTAVVREAIARGRGLVVAAGGDGTVSAVADGLVGTGLALGIIPLGTANVLARELGVPVELEAACKLLAGEHATKDVDAMRVNGRCYLTQVGIGIDALMIRDTPTHQKRRFGRAAYLWTAFTRLVGFQPRRFHIEVDGKTIKAWGTQVVVANGGVLGEPPFRWGPGVRPDDGRIDVCIVSARSFWHYTRLAWHVVRGQHERNPNVRYASATRAVTVALRRGSLPVQADGEIVGETPVTIEVVPRALRVALPPGQPEPAAAGPMGMTASRG